MILFLTIAAAILAVLPWTVAEDRNAYNTSLGALSTYNGGLDFYSNCWKFKGCIWEQAFDVSGKKIAGTRQCSCNKNPDKWANLIRFYTKASFTGDVYKGFGNYGQCQDLPTTWLRKTESMQIIPDPPAICSIYTQRSCNGRAGLWESRQSMDARENSVSSFQGFYFKGVQSWKCDRKT